MKLSHLFLTMSSIDQQDNPYSPSPIPRSRSDFNYVGLTSRDKRWSTDFSNLLPSFNRDSGGYLRLQEEKTVTRQPKLARKASRNRSSNGNSSIQGNVTDNSNQQPPRDSLVDHQNPPSGPNEIDRSSNEKVNRHTPNPYHSPHLDNRFSSQRNSNGNRSPALEACVHHLHNASNGVSRSPTLDPNLLRRSPLGLNHVISSSSTSDSNDLRRIPPGVSSTVSRSPSQDSNLVRHNPIRSNLVIPRSTTLDSNVLKLHNNQVPLNPLLDSNVLRRSALMVNNVSISSPMIESNVKCHHKPVKSKEGVAPALHRHHPDVKMGTGLVRSPTADAQLFRPSVAIRRSPTMDPGSHRKSTSPLPSPAEVVRSQSLRTLRGVDSPSRMRTSSSASPTLQEEEVRRLRNFSLTTKGVVNCGDSFRSHSLTSVREGSAWELASTRCSPMASSSSWPDCKAPPRHRVAIVGAEEVGKTSLLRQFQTSEYICAFDNNFDLGGESAVTVILNGEESELEFVDHTLPDEDATSKPGLPVADAHVVVYSVTSRRSFLRALDALGAVRAIFPRSATMLVGNKSDLVRVRAVTTDEGTTAARERGCPFAETSVALNHQVDELLVAVLSGIRATRGAAGRSPPCTLARARCLLKRLLKKACLQSRSCDSL